MSETQKLRDALKVILLNPVTRDWLNHNDPKAVEQAIEALDEDPKIRMEDPYVVQLSRFHRAIEARLGGATRYVFYSAYQVDDYEVPIDNLDTLAVAGDVEVRYETWEGACYTERTKDPTLLDLAVIANRAITYTGDRHHVYFEGFDVVDFFEEDSKDYTAIRLTMGS